MFAQTLNGNATLQGAYAVRYLGAQGFPCDCPVSFSGTFTFDGKGGFQVAGQGTMNNGSDHPLTRFPPANTRCGPTESSI